MGFNLSLVAKNFSADNNLLHNTLPFASLSVSSNILVTVNPHAPIPKITALQNGDWLVLRNVKNTLILSTQKPKNSPLKSAQVKLVVEGYPIHSILAQGNAQINSNAWTDGTPLSIVASDQSNIVLNGLVNLQSVKLTDQSQLTVSWVKSPQINLYADKQSKLYFSGEAGQLLAQLDNKAQLDAKYLRTKNLHIKTRNQATAQVTPVQYFSAFALDSSQILYFKSPQHFLDMSEEFGNVLQAESN